MTYIRIPEPAIGSAVNTDIIKGDLNALRNYPRKLGGFALTGSAASGDSAIDIFIGDTKVASNVPNARAGGVVQVRTDVMAVNKIIPSNTRLQILVKTPGNTNILYTHLFMSP